jgi:cyanophycin synthetase
MMEHSDKLSYNFRVVIDELTRRGITCRLIPTTDILEANYKGHVEVIFPEHNRLVPTNYDRLMHDKYYLKKFLEDKGVPVQKGSIYRKDMIQEAVDYAASGLGFPVVIKSPAHANGEKVYANITDREDFLRVWRDAIAVSDISHFLVESYFDPSDDYRFFIMDGTNIVVAKRTPPSLVGDGVSTLGELIEAENHRRLHPRTTCLGGIYMEDFEGQRMLARQSLSLTAVLPKGKKVMLRCNANICYGALCEIVTEEVHPSYLDAARSIFKLFPGLGYCFVDFFSKDITRPAKRNMFSVNEMTTTLSITMLTQPYRGKGVNVLTPIIDRLFPETVLV